MQKFALRMFMLLAVACVPCFAHPASNDNTVSEVPFAFEKGYVIVQVRIKGDVPVDVILSTGAEHSILDSGLLEKYKLPSYYTGVGIVTGRNDTIVVYSTVADIRVGDIKLSSLNMRLSAFSEISKKLGREIFGTLGADFFKGRVAQFDFAKKVVRFLPQSLADTLKDKKAANDAAVHVVLPMIFYNEIVTLPVVENVTFDGKKIKTLFDTGTVTVLALSSSATKQLGLTPPPEKGASRADKIRLLRFDNYEITDVPATLYPKGSNFDRDNKEFGAVVGTILLQNFVVTFDFRNKLITLEHI
jgi:hypothetical protein